MRRILHGRRRIVLPDGGLTMFVRGYSENMAEAVLLAADRPERAAGQIYNCGDVHQLSLAQWVQAVAQAMDAELEIVSVPGRFAYPARDFTIRTRHSCHHLFDLHKIRSELGYRDRVAPLEALARTVRWYLEHRPTESAEQATDYATHYRTDDAMAAIYAEMEAKLAQVEHVDRAFAHPYPHPDRLGLGRDARDR